MRDAAHWWLQLENSLQRNRVHAFARYFQVATVRPNGRPANRTVVFRGTVQRGAHCAPYLTFVSDTRSGKHEDLEKCSWCEICWYLPVTREQYRITGYAEVVDAADSDALRQSTRQQIWSRLTPPLQAPFLAPTPGKPLCETSSPDIAIELNESGVPETFGLVLVLATRVDHLQLAKLNGPPPHRTCFQRRLLQSGGSDTDAPTEREVWEAEALQP
jgi:pyridoxamine 5'-phosphate oxidase